MSYTFELNNARKDANFVSGKIKETSPVVEIFSAMVDGKDIAPYVKKYGKAADKSTKYIMDLNNKAASGDPIAISEMNEIRRFVMQPILAQEIKLLSIFGTYKNIGYNESCEIEVPTIVNTDAKEQALGLDVTFPTIRKQKYPVATTTISAGYAVDYRKAALGDMTDENEIQEQVRVQIRNKAARYVIENIYKAIKGASGVHYSFEGAGMTSTGVDGVITKVRRFGKPTVTGDYALISQFNKFAGYAGTTPSVTGISLKVLDEIHDTGLMGMYNGAILSEMPNPYDLSKLNSTGDNFETMLPTGLGFVIPAGGQSPIHTITRGGLTSFSGNDVTSGMQISRYDLEVGCLVVPGHEYQIGVLCDSNLTNFGA